MVSAPAVAGTDLSETPPNGQQKYQHGCCYGIRTPASTAGTNRAPRYFCNRWLDFCCCFLGPDSDHEKGLMHRNPVTALRSAELFVDIGLNIFPGGSVIDVQKIEYEFSDGVGLGQIRVSTCTGSRVVTTS